MNDAILQYVYGMRINIVPLSKDCTKTCCDTKYESLSNGLVIHLSGVYQGLIWQ